MAYPATRSGGSGMTWNLMHLAALLKRAGGVPAHGNQRSLLGGIRPPHTFPALVGGPLTRWAVGQAASAGLRISEWGSTSTGTARSPSSH